MAHDSYPGKHFVPTGQKTNVLENTSNMCVYTRNIMDKKKCPDDFYYS